jgi:hypothetical protein
LGAEEAEVLELFIIRLGTIRMEAEAEAQVDILVEDLRLLFLEQQKQSMLGRAELHLLEITRQGRQEAIQPLEVG